MFAKGNKYFSKDIFRKYWIFMDCMLCLLFEGSGSSRFYINLKMKNRNLYEDEDISNPKMKVMKPLAQKTLAKIKKHNEFEQKEARDDVSKSKLQRGKLLAQTTHVAQFRAHGEIGQEEAHVDVSKFKVPKNNFPPTISVLQYEEDNIIGKQQALDDLSKFMVPKNKILAPTTSITQFQEQNNIGQQEVHEDVSKYKVTKRKVLNKKTSRTQFQVHSENGHQEAHGGILKLKTRGGVLKLKAHGDILKLKAPKNKISAGTSVAHFQEYYEIGQQEAHEDVSNSKMQTSKILAQTTYGAELQAHNEVGQEEPLNMSKISKEKHKSENYPKRFDSPGSPSNGLPKYSQLAKATNKYRALVRKYLTLDKESSHLEDEWKKTENEVKSLEKEKHALLDKLVVLEGLVDPSDFKYPNQKL